MPGKGIGTITAVTMIADHLRKNKKTLSAIHLRNFIKQNWSQFEKHFKRPEIAVTSIRSHIFKKSPIMITNGWVSLRPAEKELKRSL